MAIDVDSVLTPSPTASRVYVGSRTSGLLETFDGALVVLCVDR